MTKALNNLSGIGVESRKFTLIPAALGIVRGQQKMLVNKEVLKAWRRRCLVERAAAVGGPPRGSQALQSTRESEKKER